MKTQKVVSNENLPTRLPIWSSVTTLLVLDRFQSPGWVWGVVATVFAFIWIVCIVVIYAQQPVDLNELK